MWKQLVLAAIGRPGASFAPVRFLEYDGATANLVRASFELPPESVDTRSASLLRLRRYINPSLSGIREPFIFHSSYYRYCTNPRAINVTTVHDFIYERHIHGLPARVHSWQKTAALMHSDAVVCISESTRRDVLDFYQGRIDPDRVHVIPNSIDPIFLQASPKEIVSETLSHQILYVGVRLEYKNFAPLVRALAPLTDYSLTICGAPLTSSEKALLDKELGLRRYSYAGSLSAAQLCDIYRRSHCLVYPSRYEGFGLPVLEAQACGCPVLASDNSALPEVMPDKNLLLSEITTEALAAGLKYIESNRPSIIAAGIANASRYTPEATTSAYLSLYDQLLK